MAKNKKPTPKSQRQIFNDTVEPYIFPETGESYGNPNDTSNFTQFTEKEQNGVGFQVRQTRTASSAEFQKGEWKQY